MGWVTAIAAKLAVARMSCPISRLRRRPMRSAVMHANTPSAMPASCTAESRKQKACLHQAYVQGVLQHGKGGRYFPHMHRQDDA